MLRLRFNNNYYINSKSLSLKRIEELELLNLKSFRII